MSGALVPPVATGQGSIAPSRRRMRPGRVGFLLVTLGLPLAFYLGLVVWPFIQAFGYSLTNWTGFSGNFDVIGLDNYVTLWNDEVFRRAVINNILLVTVVPLVTITLALALATMLTVGGASSGAVRGLSRSSFYRVVSFFPYTIPAIVIGLIWAQNFDPSNGLINGALTSIGLSGFESYPWLGDARTAMPVSMFVIIWAFVGFYMVLFVAAIKGIPAELYDAARVDGAGRIRMTFTITVPMIRDNVQTAYIYLGIFALDAFVYMQALNPGGGPQNSTLVMPQVLYETAFRKNQFGLASAMGVVLALLTLFFAVLVILAFRLTRGKDPR